jgi:hypothetical protein
MRTCVSKMYKLTRSILNKNRIHQGITVLNRRTYPGHEKSLKTQHYFGFQEFVQRFFKNEALVGCR